MLLEALSTARDLRRAREIVSVLASHGLGDLAQRLGLVRGLRRAGTLLRIRRSEELHERPAPERMRLALERLGPTFVKLGQVLAGRTDLLPPEWTSELAKLREHASPIAWDELRVQLAEDLGADPHTVFRALDHEPLSAASIAQVHRAELEDGTPVVLKIRRPGIVATVTADLRLLARLAEIAEREIPELAPFKPRAIVRQFASALRAELDLGVEARLAPRMAAQLAHHAELVIPRVHDRFTTPRLLVQDHLDGPSVDRWLAAGRPGAHDAHAIAAAGAAIVLEMVFVHGLYHADPHGGNVLLLPDGRIGLIDFGMIGRLSSARRAEFLELLAAVVQRNDGEVARVLMQWTGDGEVDETLLASDVSALLDHHDAARLRDVDIRVLLQDIAALVRDNGLVLPADVALLLKVFVTLDGLGLALDPRFVMAEAIQPFVERTLRDARSPLSMLKRGLGEIGRAAGELPHGIRSALALLRRGRFQVEVDVRRLDQLGAALQKSVNRLTVGLVTSALIIGTSIALSVSGGPTLLGLPAFALLGFASSLVLGLALLVAIARSGRGMH